MKPENRTTKAKKTILMMLIIIPVVVFMLGKLLPGQTSPSMMRDSFWANKIANNKQYDIVVVGDSRIYRGIDPAVIANRMNTTAFNYGFSSAGLDSVLLVNAIRLLKPDGMKILLIGITPSSFTDESLKNEHLQSIMKIDSKELWIRQHLYPYLTFFNTYNLSDLKKISQNEKYFQDFNSNGFVYSNRTPVDSSAALQPYIEFLGKNKVNPEAKNKFLKLIHNLCLEGVTIYGFRMPIAAPIEKLENGAFDFDLFKREFTEPNCHWLSIPRYGFNSYDGSHLDGPSAIKLSGIIADSLANHE